MFEQIHKNYFIKLLNNVKKKKKNKRKRWKTIHTKYTTIECVR